MSTSNHFEQLRHAAQERGMRDYEREKENARVSGNPIFRNNPHQNNSATDEREFWNLGWDDARRFDEQWLRTHPLVREMAVALEPFAKFNSSLDHFQISVNNTDVRRARDLLQRIKP